MRPLRAILSCLLTVPVLLATLSPVLAQPAGERLILKDGTFQVITKYEVKADRVRFYSSERGDWEEIPSALIDWPATETWNRQHRPGASSEAVPDTSDAAQSEAAKIDAEERAERNAENARIPVVAPGLRLPDENGLWVLDTFQGGTELVHVEQANGDLNRATEHSILRASIVSSAGARELIRIEGGSAKVQLHVPDPVFYISLDAPASSGADEPPSSALTVDTHGAGEIKDKNSHSSPDSRYFILRMNSSHNLRTILASEIAQLTQPSRSEDITETVKEILPGARWMKLTPKTPLLIGEYALIEVLSPRDVNLDAWAFGLNPRARENKNVRTPIDPSP
jgi:hypothetical protein